MQFPSEVMLFVGMEDRTTQNGAAPMVTRSLAELSFQARILADGSLLPPGGDELKAHLASISTIHPT